MGVKAHKEAEVLKYVDSEFTHKAVAFVQPLAYMNQCHRTSPNYVEHAFPLLSNTVNAIFAHCEHLAAPSPMAHVSTTAECIVRSTSHGPSPTRSATAPDGGCMLALLARFPVLPTLTGVQHLMSSCSRHQPHLHSLLSSCLVRLSRL